MSDIKVKFRGVRGSYPVVKRDHLDYGGNTSCVEINIDNRKIFLDAGSGLINVGEELICDYINSGSTLTNRVPVVANIFLSHIHQDHICGIPFFAPIHTASTRLNIFGNPTQNEHMQDEISQLLFNQTFPLDAGDIAADVVCYDIGEPNYIILKKDFTTLVVNVCDYHNMQVSEDDVVVSCYKTYAHPQYGSMVYKIEYRGKTVVYATDKESYIGGDVRLAKFARGCDLLIHDAQYTTEDYQSIYTPKQGFGHSTFAMAKDMLDQAQANKVVFFHYDPSYNDEKLAQLEREIGSERLIFAKEGLEIEL